MNYSIIRFFSPGRLFHFRPATSSATLYLLASVFGLMIVVAIVIKIIEKKKKPDQYARKILSGYFRVLLIFGLAGLIYVWFRLEKIFILSARFWLIIIFVGIFVSLFYVIKYQIKVAPQARKQKEKRQVLHKYLPKRKK